MLTEVFFFGQIVIVMIDDWYSDPFHLLKISVQVIYMIISRIAMTSFEGVELHKSVH